MKKLRLRKSLVQEHQGGDGIFPSGQTDPKLEPLAAGSEGTLSKRRHLNTGTINKLEDTEE